MLKAYEAMFILPPSLKDEALEATVEDIKGEIGRLGGNVLSAKVLGTRSFARPMRKKETGQYFRLDMKIAPDAIARFLARMKLKPHVFRVQIVCAAESKETAMETAAQKAAEPQEEGNDGES